MLRWDAVFVWFGVVYAKRNEMVFDFDTMPHLFAIRIMVIHYLSQRILIIMNNVVLGFEF